MHLISTFCYFNKVIYSKNCFKQLIYFKYIYNNFIFLLILNNYNKFKIKLIKK